MNPRFPRILTGAGTLRRVGRAAKSLGAARAVVFSDPGVVEAGHAGRVVGHLELAGLDVALHAEIQPNPTTADVAAAVEALAAFEPAVLVAVGGGSAMDPAKAAHRLRPPGGEVPAARTSPA